MDFIYQILNHFCLIRETSLIFLVIRTSFVRYALDDVKKQGIGYKLARVFLINIAPYLKFGFPSLCLFFSFKAVQTIVSIYKPTLPRRFSDVFDILLAYIFQQERINKKGTTGKELLSHVVRLVSDETYRTDNPQELEEAKDGNQTSRQTKDEIIE